MHTNRLKMKRRPSRRPAGRNGNSPGIGKPIRYRGYKSSMAIDPEQLVKKVVQQEITTFKSDISFDQMPIHPHLKAALRNKGYDSPTEIQYKTMDHLISGRNLIGVAKTGTGKTAAFLVPIIHQLLEADSPFQSLIVVPTRELAKQVESEFNSLARTLRMYITCYIGGTSTHTDIQRSKRFSHIIVGTPGRLLDLHRRGALDLRRFSVLVLDEFDRMLDMGFIRDVEQIAGAMINRNQTLLFSATKDDTQHYLIAQLMEKPVTVMVSSGRVASDHVEQDIIRVPKGECKTHLLTHLIKKDGFNKVLVFVDTKRMADRIHSKLYKSGVQTALIHGDKSQVNRKKALDRFRNGQVQVLVATDVAARGLDIYNVTHVINYNIPKDYESYIHRIGRTGRAGNMGKALTFVD